MQATAPSERWRQTVYLDLEELSGAQQVLGAAAMTYVAALITSLAQLFRLILLFGRRDED